jgi:type II secretory pathway pseudopilin PulG
MNLPGVKFINYRRPIFKARKLAASRAFTIIEIALCLAIIGFALVAIIAVLPRGLNVQKRNREETIIDEDAGVWMDAIRSGAKGYGDLTNYILSITNQYASYKNDGTLVSGPSNYDWYTPNGSSVSAQLALTDSTNIIGILSMPKIIPPPPTRGGDFQSNYIIAYVRAFSGQEVDKIPQTNATILGDAFVYRMIVENTPYTPQDTNGYCLDCPATNGATSDQMLARTNMARLVALLQGNSHDIRLRFRWPVLPNGQIPNYGLATFRSMASGVMFNYVTNGQPLYFIQPSIYGTNTL